MTTGPGYSSEEKGVISLRAAASDAKETAGFPGLCDWHPLGRTGATVEYRKKTWKSYLKKTEKPSRGWEAVWGTEKGRGRANKVHRCGTGGREKTDTKEMYMPGMPKEGKVPENRKPSKCLMLRGRGTWRLKRTHPIQEMAQNTPSGDLLL